MRSLVDAGVGSLYTSLRLLFSMFSFSTLFCRIKDKLLLLTNATFYFCLQTLMRYNKRKKLELLDAEFKDEQGGLLLFLEDLLALQN